MLISFARDERAYQAMCGVITQFSALSSGLSAGGGSTSSTSKAAPAIVPDPRARRQHRT